MQLLVATAEEKKNLSDSMKDFVFLIEFTFITEK